MTTPVVFAASQGDVRGVCQMLDSGDADVEDCDAQQQTALHHAARGGFFSLAEELVLRGADVRAKTIGGKEPIHHACTAGQKDLIRFLASKGADLNVATADERKWTPVHCAVHSGFVDCIAVLDELGADLHRTGARGWTPLHQAAFLGRYQITQYLLEHGGDTLRRNDAGKTPSRLAKEQKHKEVYDLIKRTKNAQLKNAQDLKKSMGGTGFFGSLKRSAALSQSQSPSPPRRNDSTLASSGASDLSRSVDPSSNRPKSKLSPLTSPRESLPMWSCPVCAYAKNTKSVCEVCGEKVSSDLSDRQSAGGLSSSRDDTFGGGGGGGGGDQLSAMLSRLDLDKYAGTFADNEIDYDAFKLLSEQDLKDMGVTALGPRRKLLAEIDRLAGRQAATAVPKAMMTAPLRSSAGVGRDCGSENLRDSSMGGNPSPFMQTAPTRTTELVYTAPPSPKVSRGVGMITSTASSKICQKCRRMAQGGANKISVGDGESIWCCAACTAKHFPQARQQEGGGGGGGGGGGNRGALHRQTSVHTGFANKELPATPSVDADEGEELYSIIPIRRPGDENYQSFDDYVSVPIEQTQQSAERLRERDTGSYGFIPAEAGGSGGGAGRSTSTARPSYGGVPGKL